METLTEDVSGPLAIPKIDLSISFLSSATLAEVYSWEGSFDEYFSWLWTGDDVLLLRDEVTWNESDGSYLGYSLNPALGS